MLTSLCSRQWFAAALLGLASVGACAQPSPTTVDYILLPLSAPRSEEPTPTLGLDQLLGAASQRLGSGLRQADRAVVWSPSAQTQVVAAQFLGFASDVALQGLGLCGNAPLSPLRIDASCSVPGSEPLVLTLSGVGVEANARVGARTDLSIAGAVVQPRAVTFSQDFLAVPIGAGGAAAAQMASQRSASLGAGYWLDAQTRLSIGVGVRDQNATPWLTGFREQSINLGFSRDQLSGSLVGRLINVDGPTQRVTGSSIDMGLILRLPWRAALSVGAKNVLKSTPSVSKKAPMGIAAEDDLLDRMTYIRYEQDL
jgi:hypothetical protein